MYLVTMLIDPALRRVPVMSVKGGVGVQPMSG
jgi:hypothetical protein